MAVQVFNPPAAAFVVSEANFWRSRDEVFVAVPAVGIKSGQLLKAGATAADPLVPVDAVADTPVCVALFSADRDDEAVAQTVKLTVMARDAELVGNLIVFPAGATQAQKQTLVDALAPAGIVVRW